MKYKIKILEFKQLGWVPEDDVSIDRHHSVLSTFWIVEINKKKCIFIYADIKLYYAEYEQDQDCNIVVRPDPNFLRIWANDSEPDYSSEDRMKLQDNDECLFTRPKLIENWYKNQEQKTETYSAYEDIDYSKEEQTEYLLFYNQIKAIYEHLCPEPEIKSTEDLKTTEFDIKV